MLEEIVLPARWEVLLDNCQKEESVVSLQAHITTNIALCPDCCFTSGRVHSRYVRHPADLPLAGHLVRIHLNVRRFFCDNIGCARRTFAEQVPALLERKARRNTRQYLFLKEQAFALGGEPGSRFIMD